MKFVKKDSGFLLSYLINLAFNLEWTVPAWIALALHFIFGISLWWFIGAIIIWLMAVLFKTLVLFLLNKAGNMPEKYRENKNPYSSKGYTPIEKSEEGKN